MTKYRRGKVTENRGTKIVRTHGGAKIVRVRGVTIEQLRAARKKVGEALDETVKDVVDNRRNLTSQQAKEAIKTAISVGMGTRRKDG